MSDELKKKIVDTLQPLAERAFCPTGEGGGIDNSCSPKEGKVTEHEQTIESHVDSNVEMAIDQAEEYGGLENAFYSFMQNTRDSVKEDGYTEQEAFDAGKWFTDKFNERTGLAL